MAVPAGVRLHHPAGTDEDAVVALVLTTTCQLADTGRADRELVDVLEDWARPGVDLSRDAWLAEDGGGETVGYAFVAPPHAEIRVHPRARGMGLGSHLRELVEARATERGADELRQRIATGDRTAEQPLEQSGYVPILHAWRVERTLDVTPEPSDWPPGVAEAEPDDERDVAEVLALLERAEANDADGEPLALDRFHPEHLSDQRLDRGLCVLARRSDGDRLVGAAICESWNDADGIVVQLAIDPREDTSVLSRAVLLAAFGRMHARGLETVMVPVTGEDPSLPKLYEAIGLRPVWQQTTWCKRLAG